MTIEPLPAAPFDTLIADGSWAIGLPGVDATLLARAEPLTVSSHARWYAPPAGPPRYTAGSRPELESFAREAAAGALHAAQIAVALTRFVARIPRRYPTAERPTVAGFYGDFSTFLAGGTEEEVIKKGSPLAAERARVLCALAQVAGIPARIAYLCRVDPPEPHTVAELFVSGRWSVFDGFTGRFYVWPKHGYLDAWDGHRQPQFINQHPDHGRDRYVDGAYYRHVALATYDLADWGRYLYPWSLLPAGAAERLRAGQGA